MKMAILLALAVYPFTLILAVDIKDYYISINDTLFQLHVFWLSDTECCITLTFSESVYLSLKPRLLNVTKHAARNVKCSLAITFKKWIFF